MKTGSSFVLGFESVCFGYPGYEPVLNGFSAELGSGEIVCVIGPSGCGKSTMLNLAGGFLSPDEGRVRDTHGRVAAPSPARVMVFQDSSQLFPWLDVRSNVIFPMKAFASGEKVKFMHSEAVQTADRLLAFVGLAEAAGLFPAQLSGGMKQRAVVARALATSPEILLLDEPFTALDAPTRRGLQDMLLGLNRELGTSMLFVTHDIREAVYLADRLLIMTSGNPVELEVGLNRGPGERDEFSDEFVRIEREVYKIISP